MFNWITDREPTIKDGDSWGHVLTISSDGNVILDRFNQVKLGTPWMSPPEPPKKPSTRWHVGTHHNVLTDDEFIVIVSGGDTTKESGKERIKIVNIIIDSLNKELP